MGQSMGQSMTLSPSATIHEQRRQVPVIAQADLCVLGGSCTGVFAAVRAARLGAQVVLVEKAGGFGGNATLSLVNVWHSPLDATYQKPIIGGLTVEVMQRLQCRDAVMERHDSPHWRWAFNPFELQIELDELVREAGVQPMLHTLFVTPHVVDGKLEAVIVENKDGRGAIRAGAFIDATGDGDLCRRLGLPMYNAQDAQPSTACAIFSGWSSLKEVDIGQLMRQHGHQMSLPGGFAWGAPIPPFSDLYLLAGTRVVSADCAESQQLTEAEMEGRRQVRAIMDLLRRHVPQQRLTLAALPARIGIRQTRHVRCAYQLTGRDVLSGRRFEDAIANGSYRVDVHHRDKPGITLKYLDGTQEYCCPGQPVQRSRWREPIAEDPTFYQIPYRCLVPGGVDNLLVAGRMIDADPEAFAAVRVMVNCNQMGEAAGVAAWMALRNGVPVSCLDVQRLRQTLAEGGSIIL